MALTEMASFRRGTWDKQSFLIYSGRLSKENVEDVVAALEKIQYMQREAGENAIPEIGAILAVVKVEGIARQNREASAGKTVLAAWRCPKCSLTRTGYIAPDDYEQRYCQRKGCGVALEEVRREVAA